MRHFLLIASLAAWSCVSFAQTEPGFGEAPAAPVMLLKDDKPIAEGTEVTTTSRSEDDLVIVTLKLGRNILNEAVEGYSNKGSLMLPLGQLAEALQFPIRVSPRDGKADGWFLDTGNHFSLDLSRHEAIVAGERQSFSPTLAEAHDDDMYVDTSLLSQWFPLEFNFSFATQTVSIKAKSGILLPVEQLAARDKLHTRLGNRKEDDTLPLPRADAPYRLFSIPFADITYTTGGDTQDQRGWANDLSVLANGDLFYMHSSLFFSASETEPMDDLRWTLSRRDPDGKLFREENLQDNPVAQVFNALQVRELALGDIYTQQLPLTAFNQQGRGVLISTKPYDRATQFNRTTLQGDLPPDWEVELYRNDELLDFQRTTINGRYEFVDVPLLSGLNIIRLVFYGPFGQTREEVQRFMVSPNIAEEGKSYFQVSLSQQDSSIFSMRDDIPVNTTGITGNERGAARGEPRLMMEYEYGLSQNISLFSSLAHLTTGDGIARTYATGGAATTLAGIYSRMDVSEDIEHNAHAFELNLQGTLYGMSLTGQHQQFYDFISEFTESVNDPVTSRTTARADAPMNVLFLPRFNTGVSALRQLYDSGRKRYEINEHMSTAIDRLAVSHIVTWRQEESAASVTNRETRSDLLVSFPYRDLILRSDLTYNLSPGFSAEALAVTAEYRLSRDMTARVEVSRQMGPAALTTYTTALNRDFGKFMLGARASHSDNGNSAIGATLSLSIGEDSRNGRLHMFPEYSADDGFVSARAFHDKNANGYYDEGDSVIENARFHVNRGGSDSVTGSDGIALLRNIPADVPTRVTLDNSSIDDPYMSAIIPGAEIVARPGVPVEVDIALVSTADIEGTVYIVGDDGSKKEAANVQVQALDATGKVVRENRSAFDGYYLLEGLPVDKYTLRVAPEQENRLGLEGSERQVRINPGEESMIINLTVKR